MSIAQIADVQAALRRALRGDEERYIPALINRAEIIIRARHRNLDVLAGDPLIFDLIRDIEAEAVARVLRAENNGIYRSETEDGYSYQLNYMVASGLIDILAADWAKIRDAIGIGGVHSTAPETDGYAQQKYGLGAGRPDLNFQYKFKCGNSLADTWTTP